MDKQEYYNSSFGYVTIWGEVADKPDMVIVTNGNDYGELSVISRSQLIKKEDSYTFKQAQKRADELRMITAKAQENLEKLTDKLVDKALIALSSRLKFNALFGNGSGNMAWAGLVIEELEKLVKEKAEEVIKDKKDPFA